ncbi:MAG: hydrolase, partial [Muribaculaceae bacterium]|nr:hydrolase [Muribaculaceae bacterium]
TYVGPNPHTRETSLLMMADSVEAASRSLPDYTTESITALVNRIIDAQIADGLHNESTIAFRDIPAIKEAFIKRLKTMYHARVAYPTMNGAPA